MTVYYLSQSMSFTTLSLYHRKNTTNFVGIAIKIKPKVIAQSVCEHSIVNVLQRMVNKLMWMRMSGLAQFVRSSRYPKGIKGIFDPRILENPIFPSILDDLFGWHDFFFLYSREHLKMLPLIVEHVWNEKKVCLFRPLHVVSVILDHCMLFRFDLNS